MEDLKIAGLNKELLMKLINKEVVLEVLKEDYGEAEEDHIGHMDLQLLDNGIKVELDEDGYPQNCIIKAKLDIWHVLEDEDQYDTLETFMEMILEKPQFKFDEINVDTKEVILQTLTEALDLRFSQLKEGRDSQGLTKIINLLLWALIKEEVKAGDPDKREEIIVRYQRMLSNNPDLGNLDHEKLLKVD